jgi:hypothetical protein
LQTCDASYEDKREVRCVAWSRFVSSSAEMTRDHPLNTDRRYFPDMSNFLIEQALRIHPRFIIHSTIATLPHSLLSNSSLRNIALLSPPSPFPPSTAVFCTLGCWELYKEEKEFKRI